MSTGPPYYPLTAPKVRPLTIYRWIAIARMVGGITAVSMRVETYQNCTPWTSWVPAIMTVIECLLGENKGIQKLIPGKSKADDATYRAGATRGAIPNKLRAAVITDSPPRVFSKGIADHDGKGMVGHIDRISARGLLIQLASSGKG